LPFGGKAVAGRSPFSAVEAGVDPRPLAPLFECRNLPAFIPGPDTTIPSEVLGDRTGKPGSRGVTRRLRLLPKRR